MAAPIQDDESPKDILFEDLITSVKCHPSQDLIACGLINGEVHVYSHSFSESNKEVHKFIRHRKACRGLCFSEDGRRLFSISKDKSLICSDIETGGLKKKIKNAHESPLYSLALTGENFVATGDDEGVIKVWDMRTKDATMELKECDDFISDMMIDDEKKILLASSGEGTLTAFNIRRKRMEVQSELFDSELLCLAKMKNGRKLVCGTGEGVINVFNWGQWGNISDRFPCGEEQIDSLIAVTDNVMCIGTNDGYIRAVHVLPNRVLGLVGQHEDGFPIEALSMTADGSNIASCSHDQRVKFWNVEEVKTQTVDTSKKGTKKAKKKIVKFGKAKKNDFFAGLVDDGGDNEDKDSSCDDSD